MNENNSRFDQGLHIDKITLEIYRVLLSNTLHSPAPYVRHVCCLLCNIAKSRVCGTMTVGNF